MPIRPPTYHAFLLRLWKTNNNLDDPQWRATLERPGSGSRVGFGDLESLFAYLLAQCVASSLEEMSVRRESIHPTKESQ